MPKPETGGMSEITDTSMERIYGVPGGCDITYDVHGKKYLTYFFFCQRTRSSEFKGTM